MDAKKISFIIYKTNDEICEATKKSLEQMTAGGYAVDVLTVEGENKYAAYNSALKNSDAKYKIYVDEKIEVRQKNFLSDIIKIFKSDEKIGVIGVSGAVKISTSGDCFKSARRCGKIFLGENRDAKDWSSVDGKSKEVEAVDGFFIATQYDLDWRADLFEKNSFGETAQCLEFKRNGYKIVVAAQKKPFLWFRADDLPADDADKKNFLNEYSKELFPLVTVIIPTFNRPKLFETALKSALNQTYRNLEIIISDNSTEDDTENLVKEFTEKDPRIKYFRHKDFSADDNWNFARSYDNPDAEFVNWLMDNNIFYPRKIEIMVEIYRNHPEVSLVTSKRDFLDATGAVKYKGRAIAKQSGRLKGDDAGKLLFTIEQKIFAATKNLKGEISYTTPAFSSDNYIGGMTNVLIRKKFLRENDLCFAEDEKGFYPLADLSTWAYLLTQGSLYWISEPLSASRGHAEQATYHEGRGSLNALCWLKLIKNLWDKKIFLKTEDDARNAIFNWIRTAALKFDEARIKKYHGQEVIALEEANIAVAESLVNGCKIELPPSVQAEFEKFR